MSDESKDEKQVSGATPENTARLKSLAMRMIEAIGDEAKMEAMRPEVEAEVKRIMTERIEKGDYTSASEALRLLIGSRQEAEENERAVVGIADNKAEVLFLCKTDEGAKKLKVLLDGEVLQFKARAKVKQPKDFSFMEKPEALQA